VVRAASHGSTESVEHLQLMQCRLGVLYSDVQLLLDAVNLLSNMFLPEVGSFWSTVSPKARAYQG